MNRKARKIAVSISIIALVIAALLGYRIYSVVHIKRDPRNVRMFLKENGLSGIPRGYQVDHIMPLCAGGDDSPDNMQLLTIREHKRKTRDDVRKCRDMWERKVWRWLQGK